MRHVAPELLSLLKDDRMFSSREYERFFGDKFLTAMVKDADDFEKVKKFAGRSGGPIPKRSQNRSTSGQSGYGYRNADNRYQHFSSGSRNSGRNYPNSSSKQQQTSRYVSRSSVSPPHLQLQVVCLSLVTPGPNFRQIHGFRRLS